MSSEFTYLECACMTPDHTLRFWTGDETMQLYVECHLRKVSLLKRLKYAILYVFGKQSKYGAFEETVLDLKAQIELAKLLPR